MSSSSNDNEDSVDEDGGGKGMVKVLGKRQDGVMSSSSPSAKIVKFVGSWSFLENARTKNIVNKPPIAKKRDFLQTRMFV